MSKRIYFETTETKTVNKKGWIEIDTDFTQIYNCFSHISDKINSATSYKLLFWLLANETNNSNGICTNKAIFGKFNLYLGKNSVSEKTFYNCIDELVQSGALTKVTKGQYYFNPYIFWKDDKSARVEFIEDEAKFKQSLNPYTPTLIEDAEIIE